MQNIWELGIKMIVAIQGLGSWLEVPMKFFSFLGTEDFFMLVLPVLYWCVDSGLGLRIGFVLLTGSGLNDSLKLWMHGPRPYWYSPRVHGNAAETSFGVPSGHAQSAIEVWGMLAARIKRLWAWIAAGLIIFLIGFSRLYLGVHFPQDVLLGWLVGGLLLWLVLRLWNPVAGWLKQRTTLQQILIGLAFSLLLLLPGLLASRWLAANFSLPAAWLQNAAAAVPAGPVPDPTSIEGIVSNAGTIFGMALGLALFARGGDFQMKAAWWKLLLRVLLGVAGVFVIRYGLKAIFPEGTAWLAMALRYLRYACIGAWVTGGAPWLFVRLKLSKITE
jgi:membrane-associated phospholipid phosphatase